MYNFVAPKIKHEESNLAAVLISSVNTTNQLVISLSYRLSIFIPAISSKSQLPIKFWTKPIDPHITQNNKDVDFFIVIDF